MTTCRATPFVFCGAALPTAGAVSGRHIGESSVMETQRLKLKIGDYEFEAEGLQDTVQSQFKTFQELVLRALAVAPSAMYRRYEHPYEGFCLNCTQKITRCGSQFTLEVPCDGCGRVNVYKDSRKPTCLK